MKVFIHKLDFENIPSKIIESIPNKINTIIKQCVKFTLQQEKFKNKTELSIILCSDKEIKKLNKQYLNKNRTTDVLCFSYSIKPVLNADIFISLESAFYQSNIYAWDFINEIIFLVIHGILHSLGWNDNTEKKRKKMLQKQYQIMKSIKILWY